MADFSFVLPRLATGAAINSKQDVDELVKAGITAVIDCRGEFDDAALLGSHPDIMYLWNGVDDDGQPKPVSWFAKSIEFGLTQLAKQHSKVYAHCAAGVNRGPSTCYAIMRVCGFSRDEALAKIHFARPATVNGVRYADDADRAVASLYS